MRDDECPHAAQSVAVDLTTPTPASAAQTAGGGCLFCGRKTILEMALIQGGGRIKICKVCLSEMRKKGK